jgi:hypothetical protein
MNFYHVRVLNLPKEGSTWRFSSTSVIFNNEIWEENDMQADLKPKNDFRKAYTND